MFLGKDEKLNDINERSVKSDRLLDGDGPLVEEVAETVRRARWDEMGLGVVVYWPEIAWEDER